MIVDGGKRESADEERGNGDGDPCEGENAIDDDKELKVGKASEEVNDTGIAVRERRSRVATICWERFLGFTSIRVLLVENDDSTMHIVSALLMNCNYEVIGATNGFEAWKILEDVTNQIDLVLSEVLIPCLSGLDLLGKITSHRSCRNIPVIMMSSHDSMSLVFKFLSKGAVDFLLKPIRKNELKNLWQHVWRRCHNTSGSGSRGGTETKSSEKTKNSEKFGNNLEIGGGSDDGSGIQVHPGHMCIAPYNEICFDPRGVRLGTHKADYCPSKM